MKIGFFAESCIPIHAFTLDERPLGGTETGVIRVAEELSRRGHDVTVFTSHKNPPPSNPKYLPAPMIHKTRDLDLLVLVQGWKPAFFELPSKRVWFWTGDGPEQYSNYGIGDNRIIQRIELLLTVSNYHADSLTSASGFPRARTIIIGNGVHIPYFDGSEERAKKRLIFSSAPYRGLSFTPDLLLRIRDVHPDVEFYVFSGMNLYDREAPFEGPHVAHFKKVASVLQKIPGCVLHSTVTQRVLAREYMKSSLFFYPCSVPETCCITALEAQAGGCALITSDIGALRETVGDAGVIVSGVPGSPQFMKEFAEKTIELLNNPGLIAECSARGRTRIQSTLGWNHIVDRFESAMNTVNL